MKLYRFYAGNGFLGALWANDKAEALNKVTGLFDGFTDCIESDPNSQP